MPRPLFRRLAGDDRGASAVEFALLAPLLIAFYFGMAEFCQGFMAQKRMGHVAAMVADLVAQEDLVSKDDLDGIFDIGGLIMKPFPMTTLKQRVSSVTRTNGTALVDWSYATSDDGGLDALEEQSVVNLPDGLIGNGESIIMSEAIYDYDSPVDYLLPDLTRFSHQYYLRPRMVNKTLCSNCAPPRS